MKKAIGFIIIISIIIMGIIFYNLDYDNIKEKKEPKYCFKIVNEDKKEIKYLCLGYTMYREYSVSKTENIGDAKSLEFGIWFFDKQKIEYDYE